MVGFIKDALSKLGGPGNVAGLGLTALQAFRGFQGPDIPSGFKDALNQASVLRDALLQGEGNPTFDRLFGQEQDRIRTDLARGTRRLRIEDRRQRSRTGIGILSSERRDEAIAQAMARGHSDAKEKARVNTRNYLNQALGANNAVLGANVQQAAFDTAQFNREQGTLGALGQAAFGIQSGLRENQRADQQMNFQNKILESFLGSRMLTGDPGQRGRPSVQYSNSPIGST